jgi:hypothetical protein
MIEPTTVLEIHQSLAKMLRALVLGVAMTLLCAAIAFHVLPNVRAGSIQEFGGYLGLVLFGFATLFGLWRMLVQPGTVVVLSPSGLLDRRLCADAIAWTAIRNISTWQYRKQRFMILVVDPEYERGLRLTRMARWTRGANRALGADGLCIATAGLTINHEAMLEASLRYARIAHARSR